MFQYQGEHGWKPLNYTGLCEKILAKSQTVVSWTYFHEYSYFMRGLTTIVIIVDYICFSYQKGQKGLTI